MAKTTKTRSKRTKTPKPAKPARGKTLAEVFGGRPLHDPRDMTTEQQRALVPAVRHLLSLLAVDSGSLEADVHGAIARVEELLP